LYINYEYEMVATQVRPKYIQIIHHDTKRVDARKVPMVWIESFVMQA
jgi:hypothetical protein